MTQIMIRDGISHLPGDGICCFETLCGNVDTICGPEAEGDYEYSEGTPDCYGCISTAKHVLTLATAKEIKSWGKK